MRASHTVISWGFVLWISLCLVALVLAVADALGDHGAEERCKGRYAICVETTDGWKPYRIEEEPKEGPHE